MPAPTRRHLPQTTAITTLVPALLLAGCSTNTLQHRHRAVQHSYTFTVDGHGTAAITWSGTTSGTIANADLPWHKTIHQPHSNTHPVTLTIALGTHGGHATCSITIDGRRVSSSLARGALSRATCHTPQPADNGQRPDA